MDKKIIYNILVILFFLPIAIFLIFYVNLDFGKKPASKQILDEVSVSSSTENKIIQAEENNIIKFVGEDYKLYNNEDINNGKAYYFAPGGYPETSLNEIIINVYDKKIKAKALADSVIAEQKKYGNKVYKPFISPDNNNKDAYYITMRQINLPDQPTADIYIMKVFEINQTYSIIYRQSFPGVSSFMLEGEADDWVVTNIAEYGKAVDEINPSIVLSQIEQNNLDILEQLYKDPGNHPEIVGEPIIKDIDNDGNNEKVVRYFLSMADRLIQNLYIYREENGNYKLVKVFEGDPYGFAKMTNDQIIVGRFIPFEDLTGTKNWDEFEQFEVTRYKWMKDGAEKINVDILNATSSSSLSEELQKNFE